MKFTELLQDQLTSPTQLREAEQVIGVELPESYRTFLLTTKVGQPEADTFQVQWDGQEWAEGNEENVVAWFLAIYDGEHEDFLDYFDTFVGRIPEDTVPIARDPGGNLILIGTSKSNKGKVFFWQREFEVDPSDGDSADYSNVGFVASSFDEFINSLKEPE